MVIRIQFLCKWC